MIQRAFSIEWSDEIIFGGFIWISFLLSLITLLFLSTPCLGRNNFQISLTYAAISITEVISFHYQFFSCIAWYRESTELSIAKFSWDILAVQSTYRTVSFQTAYVFPSRIFYGALNWLQDFEWDQYSLAIPEVLRLSKPSRYFSLKYRGTSLLNVSGLILRFCLSSRF